MSTILVVEDDEDSREALAELLRSWGHTVTVASDGSEAVLCRREKLLDVILLDLGLPDIDGWEVAKVLHYSNPQAFTYLITGRDVEQTQDPVLAVLMKPLSIEMLQNAIEAAVRA